MAAATKRRWDLDSLDIIQVSVLATALDQRLFLMDDKTLAVKAKLLRLANSVKWLLESADMDSHSKIDSGTDSLQSWHQLLGVKDCFYVLLDEEDKTDGNGTNNEEQPEFYEKPAPPDCYHLKWWKQNEFHFHCLAKLPVCSSDLYC